MSSGMLPAEQLARHTPDGLSVTRSMAVLRAAAPLVRALILAGIVTALIMIGLPAVLAIASASSI
jgi:multisubunit Na+/H+ antiporter MnhC subunit